MVGTQVFPINENAITASQLVTAGNKSHISVLMYSEDCEIFSLRPIRTIITEQLQDV